MTTEKLELDRDENDFKNANRNGRKSKGKIKI